MKSFLAFVRKEMLHILRDRRTILVVLGIPVVQIIIFGFALSNEVKNTHIGLLDMAKSAESIALCNKIAASQYFEFGLTLASAAQIDEVLRSGQVQAVVVIPESFSSEFSANSKNVIQMITDGSNPNLATTLDLYLSKIVMDYQVSRAPLPLTIETINRMLYNPQMIGAYSFVPGVIALILMLICTMMTSVSIVKEKELGNMELLLVTPMNPLSVIFSKAIPYIALSLIILTIILGLSVFLLQVPVQGSLLLLYMVSLIFIIAALGLGLFISSITDSQQVAMMISLMGLLLPTVMFSGFMFPIESMPWPLQLLSNIIPAKWYFFSIQAIMIKGLGIGAITKEILILCGFALVFLALSVRKFETRLG